MPPGFMKAITAPPSVGRRVAASCASAITSPRVDSPSGRARAGQVALDPCRSPGWRAVPTAVDVLLDDRLDRRVLLGRVGLADDAGPGVFSAFSTIMFSALAATSSPVLSSIVRVMSVRIRPNDEALVISRVTPSAS